MSLELGSLLEAVAWAYAPDLEPPAGVSVLERRDQGPAQAVHVRIGRARVLLVPGTNEVADALRGRAAAAGRGPPAGNLLDLEVMAVDWDGFRVHRGAARHAERLLEWEAWLGTTDLIVGHSLGAASALLAGRRRQVRTLAVAPFLVYRGAAPADGSLSLVNPGDVVPTYPGGSWSLPGCVLRLPASSGSAIDAHHPATYAAQLGPLARLDLGPATPPSTP